MKQNPQKQDIKLAFLPWLTKWPCGGCINTSTNCADSDQVVLFHRTTLSQLIGFPQREQEAIYFPLSSPTYVHHLSFKSTNILYLFH